MTQADEEAVARDRTSFLFDWYGPRETVQIGTKTYDSPFSVFSGNVTFVYGSANYEKLARLMAGSGYEPMPLDEHRQRAFVELWVNDYRSTSVGKYTAILLFAVGQRKGAPLSGLPHPDLQPYSAALPFFAPGDKALVNLGFVVNSEPARAYGAQVLCINKELRLIQSEVDGKLRTTVMYGNDSGPHVVCRLHDAVSSNERWDSLREISSILGYDAVVAGLVQGHQGLPIPHGKLAFLYEERWRIDESRYQFNPAYWRIESSTDSVRVLSEDTEFGKRFASVDFKGYVGARDPNIKVVMFPPGMTPEPQM